MENAGNMQNIEKWDKDLEEAKEHFKTADHLIYMTYPLLKDIKIIISTTENLYQSMVCGMNAILEYDRLYKRISMLPDDFESRFNIFKSNSAPRYNIEREHILLIKDLRDIIEHRKKSPMEFIRKDKFVIADGLYRMKTLTYEKVKDFVNKAKPFVIKVNKILKTHDDAGYR